jgi:hypothetical protein
MGWFRRNGRWGAGCAIAALAIQFVLSFGHVHVEGFVQTPGLLSSLIDSAQNLSPDAADVPAAPRKHVAYGHYCAICAGIHAAGFLPASAPGLAPSAVVAGKLIVGRIPIRLAASSGIHFRARAPPAA